MSKRIFKDDAMQARFEKQGFVVVPFIDSEEVKKLTDLFYELHPNLQSGGFVSGSYSGDYDYKKKASDAFVAAFTEHYDRIFTGYQAFGGAYLYKMPNSESELSIHQDWTIVDEDKYVALNCWVPLQDIDETNGALHVVPGTQYDALHTVRAPTIPFFFSGNFDLVVKESIPMYVKAGEAVILNQSVIHYSPPNRSGKIRLAITAGVKSKGAPMRFHFFDQKSGTTDVEIYDMPEDFLIDFDNFYTDIFERPKKGVGKGFVNFPMPVLSREQLSETISRMKAAAGF